MMPAGEFDYKAYVENIESAQTEWSDDPAFLPTSITYTITFFVGVIGNFLVVFSLISDKKSRNVTSSLLVSLAVADLIYLLIFIPYEVAVKMHINWMGGKALCKISGFVEMLSAVASILNLTAVTIERYVVIVHPMQSRSWCTMGSAQKILLGVWTLAVLLSSPMLYVMKTTVFLTYDNTTHIVVEMCADDNFNTDTGQIVFAWYQLIVMFLGPTIILVACYSVVIRVLWISTKELERMTNTGQILLRDNEDDMQRRLTSRSGRSLISRTVRDHGAEVREARKQVIRMLLTIICVFLLCWGPKLIMKILKRHAPSSLHQDAFFYVILIFNLLPFLQSAANPLIYGFMSKNFRRSLRASLKTCCMCRCCHLLLRRTHLLGQADIESNSVTMNGTYTSTAGAPCRPHQTSVTAMSEFFINKDEEKEAARGGKQGTETMEV